MLSELQLELNSLSDPERAKNLSRFFKTKAGQYGEGDRFRGIKVPELRNLSRKYKELPIKDILELLHSPWHEDRLVSLFILVLQFQKGDNEIKERIFATYLKNTRWINNWDLVDSSAHKIVGAWLYDKDRSILKQLATSNSLWERRIAIIATAYFIDREEFDDCLEVSRVLLDDDHDLIHKGVGWMLREVGKRDKKTEVAFLNQYYHNMPRTMLRYAIEKFPEQERQDYLKGRI